MTRGRVAPSAPSVAVVGGGGTLGRTVVHAALAAGSRVTVVGRPGLERDAQRRGSIEDALDRDVRAGRSTPEQAAERLGRLVVTSRMQDVRGVDVVIEAIAEDVAAKRAVYDQVERVVDDDCLIASTTSTIPVHELADAARRPDRFVVAHYVWPADRIPVVEVATSRRTSVAALARLDALLTSQGKTAVHVADRPGFVITRALFAYWNAAIEAVLNGMPPDAVDSALEKFGWPMGPLRVIDATGPASVARIYTRLEPALPQPLAGLRGLARAVARGERRFYVRHLGRRRVNEAMVAAIRGGQHAVGSPDAHEVVPAIMRALATEVDAAVTANAVPSWRAAGLAIDLAYGFPRSHGGLEMWWSTSNFATSTDAPHAAAVT